MGARRCIVAATALGLSVLGAGPRAGAASPAGAGDTREAAVSAAVSSAVRAAAPAVVRIEIARDGDGGRGPSASGIVIDTLGDVVTSADAVAEAGGLRVVLQDGRVLAARVRGVDPHSGVAVVQASGAARDFATARFADSDLVEIGEWVLTISRPAAGGERVGRSLVSERHREPLPSPISAAVGGRESFVTDATTAPGDGPGAPVVNLDGEFVALTVGAQDRQLPINRVRRVAQMIIARGEARYPYIGVLLVDVGDLEPRARADLGGSPEQGAVVSRVVAGAPAARAGLQPGDVITTVDNLETRAADEVVDRVSDHDVGERVRIGFVRAGQARSVQVGVAALPVSVDGWPSPSPRAALPAAVSPGPRVRTSWVISAGAPSRIGGPQ